LWRDLAGTVTGVTNKEAINPRNLRDQKNGSTRMHAEHRSSCGVRASIKLIAISTKSTHQQVHSQAKQQRQVTDFASSSNDTTHNNKRTSETHISPLTMEYFSDIEVEKETDTKKYNCSAMLDSADNIVGIEENYYTILDKKNKWFARVNFVRRLKIMKCVFVMYFYRRLEIMRNC
jgi:hypothetical protein